MNEIEEGLHQIHQNSASLGIDPNGTNAPTPTEDMIAFALINKVDIGSPAQTDVCFFLLGLIDIFYK